MNDVIVGSIREIKSQVTEPSSEELKIYHPWMKDDTSIPPYIRILNKSVEYNPRHAQWDEMEVWANHFFAEAFPDINFEHCDHEWGRRQRVIDWIQLEIIRDWWKRLHCRLWGHDEKIDREKIYCDRCGCSESQLRVLSGSWFYPTAHVKGFIRELPLSAFVAINHWLYPFAYSIIYRLPNWLKSPFARAIAILTWFDYIWFYDDYGLYEDPVNDIYLESVKQFLENGTEQHWLEMKAYLDKQSGCATL